MADTGRKPRRNPGSEPTPFDERTRRVLELRKQVREGTYRPDPEAIARALLCEWALAGDPLDEPALASSADLRALAERFVVAPGGPDEDTPAPEARIA